MSVLGKVLSKTRKVNQRNFARVLAGLWNVFRWLSIWDQNIVKSHNTEFLGLYYFKLAVWIPCSKTSPSYQKNSTHKMSGLSGRSSRLLPDMLDFYYYWFIFKHWVWTVFWINSVQCNVSGYQLIGCCWSLKYNCSSVSMGVLFQAHHGRNPL